MSRQYSTPPRTWWGLLVLFFLMDASLRSADPEPIKASAEWSGTCDNEELEKIAPAFLTTQEGLGILWKAWNMKGDVPTIDFSESLVVVTTTRGGSLRVNFAANEKADLLVRGIATTDLRPGFRYHLGVIDRSRILSVNGAVVPPLPRLAGPAMPVAKPYIPETLLTGNLRLNASNTTSHLVELWSAGFQKFHSDLKVTIKSVGGETEDPAYEDGQAAVTFISRPVGIDELGAWEKKTKLRMMAFPICEDDIALIVHQDNPIKQLTMAQLKVIFAASKERPTWGELGLTDTWASKPIFIHGRDERSGTRNHLRRTILGTGEDVVGKIHGSYSSLVEAVAKDPNSIGYCRNLFIKDDVRAVPIVKDNESQPYFPRTCSLVIGVPPDKPIPPLVKEFLVYLYRADGQSQLFQDGFRPVGKEVINLQFERLGLDEIK